MIGLLASSFVALAGPSETVNLTATEDVPIADAEWTIMVYMDADNSLEPNGYQDLAELEEVGSKLGVNILVLFDALSYEGTHWFYIGLNSDHILDDGTIKCDCEKIAGKHPGELNMGDGKNLTYFIKTAATYAPAQKYYLDLWDHGGGWWGICFDDSSPLPSGSDDRLEMAEAQEAVKASGVHLNVIDYDACFMGMIEIAYQNREIADYMVASITTEPGTGYDYSLLLEKIYALGVGKMDPLSVSIATVDAYIETYSYSDAGVGGYPYVSSSVFDLKEVVNLVGVGKNAGMDALGEILLEHAEEFDLRGVIQSSEAQTPQLQFMNEQFPFIDIGYFLELLSAKAPEDIAKIASDTFELMDDNEVVVYCRSVTTDMGTPLKTYGISVYYTICWGHLYESYLNLDMDFVTNTHWDEFLFTFSQVYVYP